MVVCVDSKAIHEEHEEWHEAHQEFMIQIRSRMHRYKCCFLRALFVIFVPCFSGAKPPGKAKRVKAGSRRDAEAQRMSKTEDSSREGAKARTEANKTQSRSPGKRSAPGTSIRCGARSRMRATRLSGLQNRPGLLPLPFSASPRRCASCFSGLKVARPDARLCPVMVQ